MPSADVVKARRKKLVGVLKKKMVDKHNVDNNKGLNDQLRGIVDDVMVTVSGTNVTRDDLGEYVSYHWVAAVGFPLASPFPPFSVGKLTVSSGWLDIDILTCLILA